MKLRVSFISSLLVLLSACVAPPQKMTAEDRTTLTSVRIESFKPRPTALYLNLPSAANIGMLFGAVGGAIGAIAGSSSRQEMSLAFIEVLTKNSISVIDIMKEEFEAGLKASGKLQLKNPDDTTPGATIRVSVQRFGFSIPTLLSASVVPILEARCELVGVDGRILWSAGDKISASILNPVDSVNWERMAGDPKLLEEQLRKAARAVTKNILAEL
jgi:hypothetical protein